MSREEEREDILRRLRLEEIDNREAVISLLDLGYGDAEQLVFLSENEERDFP